MLEVDVFDGAVRREGGFEVEGRRWSIWIIFYVFGGGFHEASDGEFEVGDFRENPVDVSEFFCADDGTAFVTIGFVEPDSGDALTGAISLVGSVDYEDVASYVLVVRATGSFIGEAEQVIRSCTGGSVGALGSAL